MERYKVIISGGGLLREIDLPPDAAHVRFGTERGCVPRFDKDRFFEGFVIDIVRQEDVWTLFCQENTYVSTDGIIKLTAKQLEHGDTLVVKYKGSNNALLTLSFMLNFDYEYKEYERAIDITDSNSFTIGGMAGSNIQLQDPLMGQEFITLVKRQGSWYVQSNNFRYGVYLNGGYVKGEAPVKDYDFFSIIGYSFYYKHNKLYTTKASTLVVNGLPSALKPESDGHFEYPLFTRNTRIRHKVPEEEVPVLAPPNAPTKPEQNIVMSLVPALTMLALTVVVRGQMGGGNPSFIIFSVCSMGLGIITSIVSFISSKKKYKKETKERIEKYTAYIEDKKKSLEALRREERNILENVYFSESKELTLVQNFSSQLFDRTTEDEDYLVLRLGTGAVRSNQQVGYKPQETLEIEDDLAELPAALEAEFRHLPKAPIVLNAKTAGAIGFVGARPRLYGIMKNILLDITTRHYHNDVQLFFLMEEEQAAQLSWLRLLPHLYNEMLGMRNIVCNDESKNILFEYLYKIFSMREETGIAYPNIIVFVYNDVGIRSHPLSQYIKKAEKMGVTFLFFEETADKIPLHCSHVVKLREDENSGVMVSSLDSNERHAFSFEPVDDMQAAYLAMRLAPVYCEEISLEGSLTKNISLYELLNVYSVADLDLGRRWQESQIHKSMAAPLGVKSKSEVVALDLHEKYHGPHGLVAGTTGSGKSEILQSYILSMATLYHPYEVGFVIIDFKGGGMVNQFKDLPHLVGSITNIDGREIDRSLLSIKAELRKRQELFAQHDVNHINAYIQLFKSGGAQIPLPHLILIVDEFAELKMDQPEFMKELVSAARIGRSLGVHLILATQKPSGVVDAQIWSNSKFKLCLKVQNKEDSNEVLKSPLAAEIKEPGRAYLQVGNNEIFELFQSAYSGAPASNENANQRAYKVFEMPLSGKKTLVFEQKPDKAGADAETQLDAIVDYVAEYCDKNNIARLPGICLPPLPQLIPFAQAVQVADKQQGIQVALGVYDDPNNQLQKQMQIDLLGGNMFIVGASQYGKTTMLQLIVRDLAARYTPAEVSIYILDFASMALKVFDPLRHVGGVVTAGDDVKLKTFFRMMSREIAQRKETFSKLGITSFASYKEAGYTDLPCIVIMLDNLTAFRELFEQYDETFLGFCREGLAVGISIIVTTPQTRGVGYKYLSNFATPVALYCNQKEEYNTLFERCRMEPRSVPGRALVTINKELFEMQGYLAFEGEKEIDRVNDIRSFIAQVAAQFPQQQARRIPEIPDVLTPDMLWQNYKTPPYCVHAGMDYDTVDAVTFNLLKMGYLAISGREKSGRTNFVHYMLHSLQQQNLPVEMHIVDGYDRQLQPLENQPLVKQYTADMDSLQNMVEQLAQECERRKKLLQQGGNKALAPVPLLLVTIAHPQFFEAGGLTKETTEACKKLMKTGKDVKLFFLFAQLENATIPYSAPDLLKAIKEGKNVLFFDDLNAFKLWDVSTVEVRKHKKPLELGDAFFMDEKETVVRIKTPKVLM